MTKMNYFKLVNEEISKEIHKMFYATSKKEAMLKWNRIGRDIKISEIEEVSYIQIEERLGLKGAYEIRCNSQLIETPMIRRY